MCFEKRFSKSCMSLTHRGRDEPLSPPAANLSFVWQSRATKTKPKGHSGTNWWDERKRDLIGKDPTYVVYTSLPKYEPEYPDGDSMLLNIDIPEIEPEYPDGERGRGALFVRCL